MKKFALLGLGLCCIGSTHAGFELDRFQTRFGLTQIEPKNNPGNLDDGTRTSVSNAYALTTDFVYFLTPNLAVDLLVGSAPKHNIYGDGQKIGNTKYIPPTLSLQYNFNPQGQWNPYVGLGVNYTYYFDETLLNGQKLDVSNSTGVAATIGMDYELNEHFSLGTDIRYVDVNSDVKINGVKVGNVDVNPMLYSLTLGYKF